jgi:2-haloalkanoic acid dehalogenase type II
MNRIYDHITFDCYGTLVDWDAGISSALLRAGAQAGLSLERNDVMAAYHEIEPAVQGEAYRSYRDVLKESARRVAERFDWALCDEDAEFLPGSIGDWPPFADAAPALRRLAVAGHRLGILSNVDRDLIARTLVNFDVEFDLIVTAEDVSSYKPAHGHFLAARRSIGASRWLHAAQSYRHDIVPTSDLRIPAVWINRKKETPAGSQRPDRELTTLTELADWLT